MKKNFYSNNITFPGTHKTIRKIKMGRLNKNLPKFVPTIYKNKKKNPAFSRNTDYNKLKVSGLCSTGAYIIEFQAPTK